MDVVKTRLIYTAGTFSLTEQLASCRRLIIKSSVLRFPPTVVYSSEKSNPPKYFLGYAALFVNDYCEKLIPLEFDPQAVLIYDNLPLQLYYTILCTGALQVDNLVRLGSVLTPPAVLIPITNAPSPFPGCVYTSLKFKLLFGTRLQIDAVGDPTIACDGVTVNVSLPNLSAPPAKYPGDRARSDDPARSEPEPGELPGDTSAASLEDPDVSLSAGPVNLKVSYHRGATPGRPDLGDVDVTYSVPNRTYTALLIDGTPPGACPTIQPQISIARSPGNADIVLFTHNTCNALSIFAQEFV